MPVIIEPTHRTGQWSATVTPTAATFSFPILLDVRGLPYVRTWPGRGFGLVRPEVEAFYAAIIEVMNRPAYWNARQGRPVDNAKDLELWSGPHHDHDEDFLYLSGPADCGVPTEVGYRPTTTLTIDHVDLRGLRMRLAAYLFRKAHAERDVSFG